MEVLIGMACVAGILWLWFRLGRSCAMKRWTAAGGVRRALSEQSRQAEYLGLASVGDQQFDNMLRATLADDGIRVSFKNEDDEVFLPVELVTVTGSKWTHPLRFGSGERTVGLNLGNAATEEAVEKRKRKSASNQQMHDIAAKRGSS